MRIDFDGEASELLARLRAAAPMGLSIGGAVKLGAQDQPISKLLARADFVAWLPESIALRDGAELAAVKRMQKRETRVVDVAKHLDEARIVDGDEAARLRAELEWPADGAIVAFRLRIDHEGGARPIEVIEALSGARPTEEVRFARLALWARDDERLVDPLDLAAVGKAVVVVASAPPAGGADDVTPAA